MGKELSPKVAKMLSVPPWMKTLRRGRSMLGKWEFLYGNLEERPYGDDSTYRKGIAFLDGHGTIEDWGCGAAYAKHFVEQSQYIGIDGSKSNFTNSVVDLKKYRSQTDCIFMRHVLEHNHEWKQILKNAVSSFKKRMVLIIFTPFMEKTDHIATWIWADVPSISFRRDDLIQFFEQFKYTEESLETDTEYKIEHIFYIEK